jgi:hypothetical protein
MVTYKQPNETVPFTMDFSDVLPTGEVLQNTSDVKIYDSSGNDVSATMLHAKSIVSPNINAVVKAGTSLSNYKITFIAITQNYRFEEDITLKVREQ